MFRRILTSLCVLLACVLQTQAGSIRSISINLSLDREGNGHFTEIWDINADEGTEWYLVKSNLRNMSVRDFSVSEGGVLFEDDGEWNVRRSLKQKAGKYGIVHGKDGVELCWGLGSMGNHIFTVRYTITGAVQTLRDYDMLHMQLVSPGLSSRPEKVTSSITASPFSFRRYFPVRSICPSHRALPHSRHSARIKQTHFFMPIPSFIVCGFIDVSTIA